MKLGTKVRIQRPETSFTGDIIGIRENWIRVTGKGSIAGTTFDEWFPLHAQKILITRLI